MAVVTETDWQAEAVRLRRDEEMATKDIAVRVDRSESQVRKVLAAANAAHAMRSPGDDVASTNGHGIPGQIDIETALDGGEIPPEDDPEYTDADLDGFREEAGEAVGPMPPKPPASVETVYVEQIRIDGTTQLALAVGGRAPESCEITFTGKAVVNGFLRKGDRLRIAGGTVLVLSEGAKDKLDKQTGIVAECVQVHSGKLIDLVIS